MREEVFEGDLASCCVSRFSIDSCFDGRSNFLVRAARNLGDALKLNSSFAVIWLSTGRITSCWATAIACSTS